MTVVEVWGGPKMVRAVVTRRVLLVAISAFAIASSRGRALAEEPLCGVHSVYTAALLLGVVDARLGGLLDPQFVGSRRGSSIAELERAAAKLGLRSLSLKRMSVDDLLQCHWPVVLHTRPDLASTEYSHFVLFGGFDGDKAVVFDGVKGRRDWTLADIASRWDGNALIVSREPIDLARLNVASRLRSGLWVLSIAGAVGLLAFAEKRRSPFAMSRLGTCRSQAVVLCVVATFGALVFHAFASNGFIAGANAVRTVRAANASTFLPKIDSTTAQRLLQSGTALFVDARTADNFRMESITGAVNLPATIPESEISRIAHAIPRDRRLVVYCSNAACAYSYITAQRLLDAGFQDVVVYPGGLEEWNSKLGPADE